MRALVVGAGHMGTFHRRVLRDLGYDVTTVDPVPGRADHRSVPRGYFEVVCVAVPIAQLADEAARWTGHEGHLLIEKPMAAGSEEAVELVGRLAGQRVAIGYVERFNPQVRRLGAELAHLPPPSWARFVRYSSRRSVNVALDLRSHDVDLASHLGLVCPVRFACAANCARQVRSIILRCGTRIHRTDLLAHDMSPLHCQWHTFLYDEPGCATPVDALGTLVTLERERAAA